MDPVDLGRFLRKSSVAYWDIPSIVCYVNYTSSLKTNHKSVFGDDVGIFGIPKTKLNVCKITEARLLDDDITDDLRCLKQLVDYRNPGWSARLSNLLHSNGWNHHDCFTWWDHLPPYNLPQIDDDCPSKGNVQNERRQLIVTGRQPTCQSGYGNAMLCVVLFICMTQILFWILILTPLLKNRRNSNDDLAPMIESCSFHM
ncbi:hypothetical protein GE061_005349 [Apolygus lucorum]|uniref:Uncharacterized protein n=1 Tax=Apolygus lucorum TaxID=248454 RepID=A0A6A4J0S8_APOLU|nr:hypothetical protein GE061_005349 [Apolygus lucorum]